jgi:hypothetical protein
MSNLKSSQLLVYTKIFTGSVPLTEPIQLLILKNIMLADSIYFLSACMSGLEIFRRYFHTFIRF